jgi:murein DD-endopeptidase MepM/ murein hydrolase activator NlpD
MSSQFMALQPQPSRVPHRGRAQASRSEGSHHSHHESPIGRQGYTLAHAGRQVRFGPVAFWIAVGTIVIMAGWSIITATYFAFHDDVLKGLMARQLEQQYAYEDRIAELREQIDRTTSRQLLSQEQFERRLDELMRRQAALESRASALGGGAEPAATGSIGASRGSEAARKPEPLGDSLLSPQRIDGKQSSIDGKLGRIAASLDRVEQDENAAIEAVQARYENKTREVKNVLASLGLRYDAAPQAAGGPFVPVRLPPANETFARALTRVAIARAQAQDVSNALTFVPLRSPLTGELEMSSPFGVRIDPFLHQPAMHTGIDLRGNLGDPVHATAAGKIVKAGWEGGYGQMVEIDHGEGLSSRYGHLSEIDVTVGQKVRIGQVIGRLGSTGRSTGPHLHYETRINGEAVNPTKFLAAGVKLFGGSSIVQVSRREIQD